MLWAVMMPVKEINKTISNLSVHSYIYMSHMLTVENVGAEPANGNGSPARN